MKNKKKKHFLVFHNQEIGSEFLEYVHGPVIENEYSHD